MDDVIEHASSAILATSGEMSVYGTEGAPLPHRGIPGRKKEG